MNDVGEAVVLVLATPPAHPAFAPYASHQKMVMALPDAGVSSPVMATY